jgi:1,4-alpha-glucan branching enzyme
MACIINFLREPYHGCRAGLPQPGRWHELVNTDAAVYGGSTAPAMGDRPDAAKRAACRSAGN